MHARMPLVLALVFILVFSGVSAAFAVLDPPPTPLGMRLRGVAFSGTAQGWAVGEGILHTDNGGASWYRQFSPREQLNAVDFASPARGWAVGEDGAVVRTIDGGATWVVRGTGHTFDLKGVDFVDSEYGWAVGGDDVVLRTTDGGLTWAAASIPLVPWGWPQVLNAVSFVSRTHGWVCGPSGTPGDGFNDLYIAKTTDGGRTWTRCSNGPYLGGGSDDMWAWSDIDFVSTTTGWVAGSALAGVRKTTDGASSWTPQPEYADRLDFFDEERGVALGGGGLSYTLNGGSSWENTLILGFEGDVCMSSAIQAWMVGQNYPFGDYEPEGLIAHSTSGGATWHIEPSSAGPVHFLGGATRYHTAANIARMTNAPAGTVVLATGRNFPDALAASGLAGALGGTLLLADTTLPPVVSDTIAGLGTTRVIIVGGDDGVSSAIESQLAADYAVERIAGADRFETAAKVAQRMVDDGASSSEVFVCNGLGFADAASAAAVAYSAEMPILLVRPDGLPAATANALEALGVTDASIVGGSAAVNDAVMAAIEDRIEPHLGTATRVAAGANRYDTSVKLANWASLGGLVDFNRIGIATGRNFPDALSGGALMGSFGNPLLLTDPSTLPPETDAFVEGAPATAGWIMNDRGEGAVRDAVATRLAYHLAH